METAEIIWSVICKIFVIIYICIFVASYIKLFITVLNTHCDVEDINKVVNNRLNTIEKTVGEIKKEIDNGKTGKTF